MRTVKQTAKVAQDKKACASNTDLPLNKSRRHAKIIGNFGESIVCNWLSRSGFDVALIDYVGIDILAYHKMNNVRLGISVKSRTRTPGKEYNPVNIMFESKSDKQNIIEACEAFNCEPWIAVYVEAGQGADLFFTSLEHYLKTYGPQPRRIHDWKMKDKHREIYDKDPNVKHIAIQFRATNWWDEELENNSEA
jgi:hypothetical protein